MSAGRDDADTAPSLAWIVVFLLVTLGAGAFAVLFVGGSLVMVA